MHTGGLSKVLDRRSGELLEEAQEFDLMYAKARTSFL